jgi:hypothetical protein
MNQLMSMPLVDQNPRLSNMAAAVMKPFLLPSKVSSRMEQKRINAEVEKNISHE